jgi:hypothetical protein
MKRRGKVATGPNSSTLSKGWWGAGIGVTLALVVVLMSRLSEIPTVPSSSEEFPDSLNHPASRQAPQRASTPARRTDLVDGWEKSLAQLRTESDPSVREQQLLTLLTAVKPGQVSEALRLLQGCESGEAVNELTALLARRWAESDPSGASSRMEQIPAGPMRVAALDQVAIAWANRDTGAAAIWARELADGERQKLLGLIASEAVRTTPVDALRLATELSPGGARDSLIARAAAEWVADDASGATEWARQLPDEALRCETLAAVATALSDRDPVGAASLTVRDLPPGRAQSDAVVSIAQRWAQQDPEKAAAWVEQFPDGELRLAAVENVAAIWSQTNAPQARRWSDRMGAETAGN